VFPSRNLINNFQKNIKDTMKITIEKISSEEESQKSKENIIKQIEEIINNEEISSKSEILERINHTNWQDEILTKST